MEKIQDATFREYVKWFAQRENSKKPTPTKQLTVPIEDEDEQSLADWCRQEINGKFLDWYPRATWKVAKLEEAEFRRLMVIDSEEATRSEGIVVPYVPRSLENAASLALANGYFREPRRPREKHYWYYLQHLYGELQLSEGNRIVVRSLQECELGQWKHYPYSFYLQDGWGRSLPYMALVMQERIKYSPVEAFVASVS